MTTPIAQGPVDVNVSRPATERLSYKQRDVLARATDEWVKLPPGIGCTNATLEALERRGLVETRYGTDGGFVVDGHQHRVWQWRKTANG